ncbi:MAG: ATP-binding protein [Butyrivibrio sp.]
MKNKVIYKFIAGFVLATLLSFILTSFITSQLTYRYSLNEEEKNLYEEASYLSTVYGSSYYSGSVSISELNLLFGSIDTISDCNIIMLDIDGTIILDTGGAHTGEVIDFDPTDAGSLNRFTDDFYGLFSNNHLTVFYPITHAFRTSGYIVISKPISLIKKDSDSVFNYNYITMLFALVINSIFIVLFIHDIGKPLRKITSHTEAYAKGDFSSKINLNRSDEIGELADALDYMGSEINSLNEYQRKFIANVSHDFRSPLTSIKGYLEAMLDGTIPPEMQQKYLGIVISETERLTKLTNNLLAVNSYNGNGMVLDISDFDIVGIIKQTIETFEVVCSKKKLKFKLVFSDKSMYVTADQSKIQQVLYNLIDNAIKFSNSDSSIIISVSEKNDKILVSVKDFGIGIPKDSLPKIWERFYKSDLSRGKDKKGTGLGLAIVKDIINAHKEYIDVVSTEGVGTEFTFALPKSKNRD